MCTLKSVPINCNYSKLGETAMRWGIEYRLDSGTYGLCLFTAKDLKEANDYVDRMCIEYGYNWLANLKPLPDGCSFDELKRMFPGYQGEKSR
jgi:hypothetical protein